ncbi:MAG TPA: type II toxin-antitoxin system VapC family toxin [Nocardioidaceae bacterium]|nr:type II toxin-antitoxin system VapC family toxin [Nocardioidaceae bacterium]
MTYVIDASSALRLVFDDEAADARRKVERLLIRDPDALAPILFLEETSNALVTAVRRQRIPAAAALEHLGRLARLPIQIAHHVPSPSSLIGLALQHDLTVYDATYLELAQFVRIPLLSYDGALRRAAQHEGIAVDDPA